MRAITLRTGIMAIIVGPLVHVALILAAPPLLNRLGIAYSSDILSEVGNYAGRAATMLVCVAALIVGQRAGLLRQYTLETEIVRRTKTDSSGREIQLARPQSFLYKPVVILLFVFALVCSWNFWHNPPSQPGDNIFGFVAFFIFVVFSIRFLVNMNYPKARIDDRGVFGTYHYFWPRLVSWKDIEEVQIERRCTAAGEESFSALIKGNTGRKLLFIDNTILGLTPFNEKVVEFIAEIKWRLAGEDTT